MSALNNLNWTTLLFKGVKSVTIFFFFSFWKKLILLFCKGALLIKSDGKTLKMLQNNFQVNAVLLNFQFTKVS